MVCTEADSDYFVFQLPNRSDVRAYFVYPGVNVEILDRNGNLLAESEPARGWGDQAIAENLPADRYYARVFIKGGGVAWYTLAIEADFAEHSQCGWTDPSLVADCEWPYWYR
jgi:hypothetical protein